MGTSGSDTSSALAVRALFFAAIELPLSACRELVRQITEFVVLQSAAEGGDVEVPTEDLAALLPIRELAGRIGHAPSTTEYMVEYRRRKHAGLTPIPTASAIVKRFGSWAGALADAGLAPPEVRKAARRRLAPARRVFRYSDQQLIDALRACARALGHRPSVREYTRWRDELIGGQPGRRSGLRHDVPSFRAIQDRWGSWRAAHAKAFGSDGGPRLQAV